VKTVCFYSHLNCKASCFIFAISIWCPARFPYQLINGNTTSTMSATSGAGTDYPEIIFIFRLCSNCSIVSFLCCVFVPFYVFSIGHCIFCFSVYCFYLHIKYLKLVLSTDGRHCYGCKTTLPFQPSVCIRIKQTSYRNEN
jgi:hypothetical protein